MMFPSDRQAMAELHGLIFGGCETRSQLSPHVALDERLAAHVGGFGVRTWASLCGAFPATAGRLQERWHRPGQGYVRGPGCMISNLNDLGAGFPLYLHEQGAPAAIVELARLEWLMVEAHARPHLAELTPAAAASLRETSQLVLQPHVIMMNVAFDVEGLRLGAKVPRRAAGVICVARAETGVGVTRLTPLQAAFLRLVAGGCSLGCLVEDGQIGDSLGALLVWALADHLLVAEGA